MPSYTKLMNVLTDLGLSKMQEHLDFYIKTVNSGEKSFSDALEELIEIEKANNQLRAINACVKTANKNTFSNSYRYRMCQKPIFYILYFF